MLLERFIVVAVLKTMILGTLFMVNGQEDLGNILSGPLNQTVALGEIVYYSCHARGLSVYWLINNIIPNPEAYKSRGFTFITEEILVPSPNELGEYNDTLIVEARPSNNNTRIACQAHGLQHGQFDRVEAILIISGPPLAPPFNLTQRHLINDAIQHILSWSAPFTSSHFPITNYTININNHHGEYITIVKSGNDFTYIHTSYGRDCYELDFSLAANNEVGQGSAFFVLTGHPIVWDEDLEIEATSTLLSNGTISINVTFMVPSVCPYQEGHYSIIIYDDISYQLALFGPTVYQQVNNTGDKTLITEEVILSAVKSTQFYEVEVSIDRNGFLISNSTRLRISSNDSEGLYTRTSPVNTKVEVTTLTTGFRHQSESISPATVTGSILGGIVLIAFSTLIIIMLAYYILSHKRKRRSISETDCDSNHSRQQPRQRPSNLKVQSSNPIYEGGAVYETMPGESFKALLSPASTPSTPSADSATRYIFDHNMIPSLPPPRKGSVCQTPTLDSMDKKVAMKRAEQLPAPLMLNDEYMIMQNPPLSKDNGITSVDTVTDAQCKT